MGQRDFIDALTRAEQEELSSHALALLAEQGLPTEGVGTYSNREKKLKKRHETARTDIVLQRRERPV